MQAALSGVKESRRLRRIGRTGVVRASRRAPFETPPAAAPQDKAAVSKDAQR
jgi:hypothetical protein